MAPLSPRHPRILVVGAGPSGLVMALALLKHGVPVRLIDKETSPRMGQRGAGIMPRSMELFQALGVAGEILARAIAAPQAVMYKMPDGVQVLSKFDMWPPTSSHSQRPYPDVVMLGQDHLEQILRSELRRLGCEPEWGACLLSFEQRAGEGCVRTRISRPSDNSEEETVETPTFDYIVGADGARGMVRKALGLSFLGETRNAENIMVGDVMVHGLDSKHWHMWGEVGEKWISLRPTEVPFMYNFLLTGEGIDHPYLIEHPEELKPIFEEYTGRRKDLVFGDVVWLSQYRPNIRMVNHFSVGRVFLAGDSAHVHSITGGQGMNTGIQDSWNLAWKMAMVQRGISPRSLLDTYTEERAPVVAAMLNQITALLNETWTGRDKGSAGSAPKTSAWKYNGGILQLGVNCRWSSAIVDEQVDEDHFADEFDDLDPFDDDDEDDGDEGMGAESEAEIMNRPLRAGDRAPDAPGLAVLKRLVPVGQTVDTFSDACTANMFHILLGCRHTILIFTDDVHRYTPVIRLARTYPRDILQTVIVLRPGSVAAPGAHALADWVLEDRSGLAHSAYSTTDHCDVIIVRPDGLVGAVLRSREGLRHYFNGIFNRPKAV